MFVCVCQNLIAGKDVKGMTVKLGIHVGANRANVRKNWLLFGCVISVLLGLLLTSLGRHTVSALEPRRSYISAMFSPAACTKVVNPGQSIQAAIDSAANGSTICVRGGTYVQTFRVRPSDSHMTVTAYPGERPIIDGQNRLPGSHVGTLIRVDGSNVVLNGFEVRNSTGRGIVVNHPADTVTVRNVDVHDNWQSGIVIKGKSSSNSTQVKYVKNVIVEDSKIHHNVRKARPTPEAGQAGGSALAFIEAQNSIARRNQVYENWGEGLVAGRRSDHITLENNVSWDNRHANLYINATTYPTARRNLIYCTTNREFWRKAGQPTYRPGPGIVLRDEMMKGNVPISHHQVVVNNIVVGCGRNFTVSSQRPGGGLRDATIAHNTFIEARGDAGSAFLNVSFSQATYVNSIFANNLIVQSNQSIARQNEKNVLNNMRVTHNLYSRAPHSSWFGGEVGRIIADPRLVNVTVQSPPNPDWYRPQSGSPAIDRGMAMPQITVDFNGTARTGAADIGAYHAGQ